MWLALGCSIFQEAKGRMEKGLYFGCASSAMCGEITTFPLIFSTQHARPMCPFVSMVYFHRKEQG